MYKSQKIRFIFNLYKINELLNKLKTVDFIRFL